MKGSDCRVSPASRTEPETPEGFSRHGLSQRRRPVTAPTAICLGARLRPTGAVAIYEATGRLNLSGFVPLLP